jgi:ABC-type multidrug transport system ATPase subunit
MRLILGLDRPDAGTATIDGRAYRDLPDPLRTVGALLEARSVHTGRSVRNHLLFLAQTQGLPARRVDEMLSHLMNEMAVTADHLIVIGRGRLITAASTSEVIARGTQKSVRVLTADPDRLATLIEADGVTVTRSAGFLTVTGMEAARIGELAASASVVLHELTPQLASLEEAFMELTAGSVEFGAPGGNVMPEPLTASAPASAQDGSAR